MVDINTPIQTVRKTQRSFAEDILPFKPVILLAVFLPNSIKFRLLYTAQDKKSSVLGKNTSYILDIRKQGDINKVVKKFVPV